MIGRVLLCTVIIAGCAGYHIPQYPPIGSLVAKVEHDLGEAGVFKYDRRWKPCDYIVDDNLVVPPGTPSFPDDRPFSPSSELRFEVPTDDTVVVEVRFPPETMKHVLLGRFLTSGCYGVQYVTSAMPSGIVMLYLSVGSWQDSMKTLIIR